jgi:hypothetical protein
LRAHSGAGTRLRVVGQARALIEASVNTGRLTEATEPRPHRTNECSGARQ